MIMCAWEYLLLSIDDIVAWCDVAWRSDRDVRIGDDDDVIG